MKPTHILAAAAITALILACFAAPAAAFSGAGSGTQSDPYIISNADDFVNFRDVVSDNTYWELSNDIDLTGISSLPATDVVTGVHFNGNGFFIKSGSITISNSVDFGLILDRITNNCEIINVGINDIDLTGNLIAGYQNSPSISLIVGELNSGSDVKNIFVKDCSIYYSASTSDEILAGGIIGHITTFGSVSSTTNIEISNILIDGLNINGDMSGSRALCGLISGQIYGSSAGSSKSVIVSNIIVVDSNYDVNNNFRSLGAIAGNFGAAASTYKTSLSNIVILSQSLSGQSSSEGIYRIGNMVSNSICTNNYALSSFKINNNVVSGGTTTNANGQDITTTQATSESFYVNTVGLDFANTWYWDETAAWQDATGTTYYGLPQLQVFVKSAPPTISAISATPATGGQLTEYALSITATTEAEGGITGYQWAYSTDSGNTWQPISGATTATYIWQPGTAFSGNVLLKCTVTGADGGTVDSYEAGYTNIKITVVPPPEIDSVSTSRPLQKVNTPTTLTATLAESEPSTYQWYYSTNGGQTWQPISGATALTAEYTPTTTGTHSVKIVVTNTYGESNELTTNFAVLPTYTPTQISNTSVDINIPGTAKYQGQTQFTLSAELKALEYFDTDRAHLAHDNALYYLDSAERQIIPLAATTGNTISSCYIGQYTGVITDISGNTAFYNYQTNTWQYIEQLSADILASTTTYAATISGTTLNLYNLNGNKVDDIETTLTNLAGNDAANTFAGYSGKTLTYYWLSGNQLSSGSQTLAHTITDVHQVPGTENYVVSTTANTYIVSISNTGAYSQVMETETADPLLQTQATTINVLIGVSDPNEIYVVGSDGETDGTYVSGSTLTDASIAKSTGLYAIAGGADFQAYILGKSESSTWQLTQVISFGEGVDYAQISTTGTYAAVATGLKLYLLEAVDVSTGTYMLQGVIIGSSGNPYAGKLISINGDQIRTDTSGRFLYPVTPNTLYTIVADTTTTEYTATSAALQQIAIRLKPNPFAQSVSYSATYNEDTGNFEMLYEDSRDLTQQVTWTIRETGDNTIVHQVTVQPGQTATWQVPFDKVFQGYQISMDAERGSINVENVWMITPAGSQPINIPGLDDTGKNIIFGCVLMIIAGLFGVMFSTKGAIFVVLAAGVMTFLGLLTIPWEIIIVAGLLAFLAALAKGGGGQ